MASIQINHINSNGSELFADSESYLHELAESEFSVQGGLLIDWYSLCTLTMDWFN